MSRLRVGIIVGMLSLVACRSGVRCGTCGMRIDPASPWASYVTVGGKEVAFDTPRCAFGAWRKAASSASGARFREYYSQEMRPAEGLRFVQGSDVVGPMGPDLVPVATENAGRFARDHNGAPPRSIEQLLEGQEP